MEELNPETFVRQLSDQVNYFSMHEEEELGKALAHAFLGTHRTLQQGMARVAYHFFQEVVARTEGDHWVDARNEDAVKWARKVAALEHYFRFI